MKNSLRVKKNLYYFNKYFGTDPWVVEVDVPTREIGRQVAKMCRDYLKGKKHKALTNNQH